MRRSPSPKTYRLASSEAAAGARKGFPGWARQQLPAEAGHCLTDRLQLEPGLSVAYTHYASSHTLVEESLVDQARSMLTITIALQGDSCYRGAGDCLFHFRCGYTTATLFGSIRGERCYRANENVRQLRLSVEETALQRYGLQGLLPTERSNPGLQLHFARTTTVVAQLTNTLLRGHGDASLPLLEMKIAALSLLAEQTRYLTAPREPGGGDLDEARLYEAHAIMLAQFARPLTLAYLCSMVGLNEFKLKRGFRRLFGDSPYRVLTGIRMQHAIELLETGMQVAQVAYRCGYEHPTSFSAAFSRFYGQAPKSMRARRY